MVVAMHVHSGAHSAVAREMDFQSRGGSSPPGLSVERTGGFESTRIVSREEWGF